MNEFGEASPAIEQSSRPCLVTVNGGSSSLKFALYEFESAEAGRPRRILGGQLERIGLPDARMSVKRAGGLQADTWGVSAANLEAAADLLIDWLGRAVGREMIAGAGFRVVHGGPRYHHAEPVTPELIAELRRIIPLDVDHLPGQIALIERFQEKLSGVPAVACFDTDFHHDLPRVAQIVPIPRKYEAAGIRRYGFHGLSYAFLMEELERVAGPGVAAGRVVLAHLGSGASLAAVRGGRPIDTTMGLTPASGLVMSTRTGDVDPAWVGFPHGRIMRWHFGRHFPFDGQPRVGPVGRPWRPAPTCAICWVRRHHDERAAEAVRGYSATRSERESGHSRRRFRGSTWSSFPAASVRILPRRAPAFAEGLDFLGITLDPARNQAGDPLISTDNARTPVRIIRTDEESMIAKVTREVLSREASS